MSSVAVTPNVVNDIVDRADERELWIVSKEMERPPYWFAEEGLNARLIKALRVVQEDRITPNSDGSYTVEGSEHRQYRVTDSCSCPQAQKGKSKWCYHHVAVALYIEWRKRCAPSAPVVLGTLRAGTAPMPSPAPALADRPLPPPIPEEQLYSSTDMRRLTSRLREEGKVPMDDDALGNGYPVDDETLPLPLPPSTIEERLAHTPVEAPRSHEEPPMPTDEYIPEPEMHDAPVALVEPSATEVREQKSTILRLLTQLGLPHDSRDACMTSVAEATGYVLESFQYPQIIASLQETLAARPAMVIPPARASLPTQFVKRIHGRDFVEYGGLLAMAHEQGLLGIAEEFISLTPELALARSVVTFADGRTFTGCADATPDNVNAGVKKHFARCALTRASARALRNALNIQAVCLQETEEGD